MADKPNSCAVTDKLANNARADARVRQRGTYRVRLNDVCSGTEFYNSGLGHFFLPVADSFSAPPHPNPLPEGKGTSTYSATTGFRSVPKGGISTSTTSPGWRKTGGLRAKPTPAGVPVNSRSPAASVQMSET